MSEKQLSRVAGCPRLPLPVFKAAAEQYFVGKDATRTEQQNGKKSKVKLLRELSTNDPAVRSWLIKFAKEYKADQTRKAAAAQGLTINADGRAVTDIDRMVALLEAGQKLEDHFTAEELNAPGDPQWDADYKEIMERTKHLGTATEQAARMAQRRRCATPGCSNDYIMDLWGVKMCNKHYQPAAINADRPSAPVDPGPAAYINDNFGKGPANPRTLALRALGDAYAAAPVCTNSNGRPMVGPVDMTNAVFVNRRD
jgi:hypothetical protein